MKTTFNHGEHGETQYGRQYRHPHQLSNSLVIIGDFFVLPMFPVVKKALNHA